MSEEPKTVQPAGWRRIWFITKGYLGLHSIEDGSTCWFSVTYFDVHDYFERKGGDGTPTHWHTYHCSRCGKGFEI